MENSQKNKQTVLLQVLPALSSGGVERGTIEIAKAAADAGYKSLVVSSGGKMERKLKEFGAEHIYAPLDKKNPFAIRKNKKVLERIIYDYNVDIIHARSRAPAWSSYYASQATGTHFITTFHGFYSSGGVTKKRYNSVMCMGEKIIAPSKFIAAHMKEVYGATDEIIEIIYRGVDMDYFDPEKVSDDRLVELRNKWRIEEGIPIAFMPGRITRWKGQEFLLRALSLMDDRPYYCVMAGDSFGHEKYAKELTDKIMRFNLEKRVRIVDAVDDMPAAYKLSDVVISASQRPEAFGRVMVEAQAMGKPVVATDIGGSKETIIHGETGRLVDPMFTKEMAKGIEKGVMLDVIQKTEIAQRNRKHIMDNFSLDSMCKKTLAVYKEILG